MSELKRCPFCGGEAKLRREMGIMYNVKCGICYCQTGQRAFEDDAIKVWNTRKPMERIIERLEETYDATHENYMKDRDLITLGRKYGLEHAIEIVKEEGGIE